MASVTGNGSKNHQSFTLEVLENSYDINNNSSEVSFTFKIAPRTSGYNWSGWGNKISYKVNIDGTEYTGTIPSYNGSSTVTLKSGTQVIGHNNDGSKTIDFSFSVTDTTGQSYTCGNASGSSTFTLTTIPRTTTNWSINGNTIGSNVTVTLVPNSSSFTHRVICYFGSDSQELTVASNQQSASATLKMAFCNQVPSAASGSGTMVVETYNGGQFIGSDSKPITLYVPDYVVPSISSVTKSDTANLVGTYGAYVQGKSNLRIQTSANGSYSSTISNITVNVKSGSTVLRTLSGGDVTLSNISYIGTLTIEVIAYDSRGRSANNTSSISVVEYFNPRINSFTAERINNDSTVTITFSANICNINNNNVNGKEFRLYKRQKGTSSWGNAILTYNSAYSYSRNDFTTTCDENYGWEFLLQAQDSFTTTSNDNPEVGTAFELINWKDDGTAMAIGKVSEKSNTFEVALDMEVNGVETINTTGNNYAGLEINNSPSRQESAITYKNGNKEYTTGYGVNSFDGWGIYSWETTKNIFEVNKNGDTTISGKFMPSTWVTENTADTWVPVWRDGYLEHRVIDANINKTMKSLERTVDRLGGNTGGGNNDWHVIGSIAYPYHVQGSQCHVKILIGEGFNGHGNQNAYIDLYLQLGWADDGTTHGRFGCYAVLHPGFTQIKRDNFQVKVMTNGDTNTAYYIAIKTDRLYSYQNIYAFTPEIAWFNKEDSWYSSLWGNECEMTYAIGQDIVEHGASNGGSYILYENGRMEAWKVVSGTTNINTAWGNCYTTASSNTIGLGDWPRGFTWEPDDVQVTVRRGGYNLMFGSIDGVSNTYAGNVSLLRFTSATNVAYTLYVHATGWWK